jgi:hypothetical protein
MQRLGTNLEFLTKERVLAAANGGISPSFNKYDGVVEWNNACFLWINIGVKDCTYPNEFDKEGKTITWFGGSRIDQSKDFIVIFLLVNCYVDSLSFKRMIAVNDDNSSDLIILFIRIHGCSYICLGRLTCLSYDVSRMPVRITWGLRDYDKLVSSSASPQVKKNLKELISVSRNKT